ncbi:MAG: lasso peptide biosynthesis B2 protein [Actinobacteria bacterium]|nr:lasso peptide biosynthesis B2 protein [Actinomycetota bacterium]
MNGKRQSWLLEMWKLKARSLRDAMRIHARTAKALLRAGVFPAVEMRALQRRLALARGADEMAVVRLVGRWFALLDRIGLRPGCLVRSLALARVLREEGYDACLVFGVRSDDGRMEGHCWVAVDGRPVMEVPTSYRELKDES